MAILPSDDNLSILSKGGFCQIHRHIILIRINTLYCLYGMSTILA